MGNYISYDDEEVDCEMPPMYSHARTKKSAKEEEPFDFSKLPADLQYKIVDKFSYKDFTVLDRTSRLGNAVCWGKTYSLKHQINTIDVYKKSVKCLFHNYDSWNYNYLRVPWHVAARPPARIESYYVHIKSRISGGKMQAISKLFEKNRTTTDTVYLTEHVTFKPADLDRLIKAVKPRTLLCRQFLSQEFFEMESIHNLRSLDMSSTGFTDDDLIKFKCDYISVTNEFVTAKGLNRFLKQWKNKKIEIKNFDINFETSFGTRNFDVILDGLDANPIWTPDLHKNSLVGKIKIEEFEAMETGDPEHIYSLWRPDDIKNTLFLSLSNGHFNVFAATDEAGYLYEYLDEDQHYMIKETCFHCEEEFCEHRRRYSMPRLKLFYPRLHNSIMLSFKGMMHTFGAFRIEKVLLGDRPFTRPPLFEYKHESKFCCLLANLRVLFFDHV